MRFSPDIRKFLDDQFAKGLHNKHEKVDPKAVVLEMKRATVSNADGNTIHQFQPKEILTYQQVASYFSQKNRKIHDLSAGEPAGAPDHNPPGDPNTSEGDPDFDYMGDPLFPTVQDELMQKLEQEGLVQELAPETTEDE